MEGADDNDSRESNFGDVVQALEEYDDEEEFIVTEVSESEKASLVARSPYIQSLMDASSLQILQRQKAERAYSENKEVGLFHLFLNKSFFHSILKWTNAELEKKGRNKITEKKLYAYVGLELAMSILRLSEIRDYWKQTMFEGHSDFSRVMSRDDFQNIRGSLRFYPFYDSPIATKDPLWHSRLMLEHFMKNCSRIAVPYGVSSLDENTVRCKARTLARSYMKSKPVKYGITFYSIVDWKEGYLHSLWDNGSGNKTGNTAADRFTHVFRDMRGLQKHFDPRIVHPSTPSAQWCLQMALQTKRQADPSRKRVIVMDNFYTRHVLAKQCSRLSDGEIKIIGTVRFNNIDGPNRPYVKQAMEELRSDSVCKGSWRLVQAFDKASNNSSPPAVASKSGYIVFKDRAIVTFYTNDLAETPTVPVQGSTEESIRCVHCLAELHRWTGNECIHRTIFHVPAIVVAYNLFMNGVDRFDQLRSTNACVRKESKVTMTLFTFLLDASIQNAFTVRNVMHPEKKTTLREFKRVVAQQLVDDYLQDRENSRKRRATAELPQTAMGTISSNHILLENLDRKSARCYLCNIMANDEKSRTSIYGCAECKRAFHVNCFAFYHFENALQEHRPILVRMILENDGNSARKKHRDRKIKCAATLENARLMFPFA